MFYSGLCPFQVREHRSGELSSRAVSIRLILVLCLNEVRAEPVDPVLCLLGNVRVDIEIEVFIS